MKVKNKNTYAEKVCKKCGAPLISKSKYKCCDNCRREQAKARKEVGGTLFGLVLMGLSCVPVVKHFIKKD